MNARPAAALRILATLTWSFLPLPSWNDLAAIREDLWIIRLGCEHTCGHHCTCFGWLARHEPDCPEQCPMYISRGCVDQ